MTIKWTPRLDKELLDLHRVRLFSFTNCATILSANHGLIIGRNACIGRYNRIRKREAGETHGWTNYEIGESFFTLMDRQRLDNSYQWARKRYGVVFTIKKATRKGQYGFSCKRIA
ncbi:hypothetical protein K3G63_04570 [Hymenobacter sp. HSC-4F20]|uniref:hypothetical protein n=1 Tax=Hymenobacter sp. HSC-4F20 TaxID=2864135 RepID=UPI001C73190F|nr:hypothetical protein [Hymenobacter sp. HSC-4F20]MBX0289697.1 hypothetical protein [Hymenobacter sp. HSC-4F20]